jgi:hypothetical protein
MKLSRDFYDGVATDLKFRLLDITKKLEQSTPAIGNILSMYLKKNLEPEYHELGLICSFLIKERARVVLLYSHHDPDTPIDDAYNNEVRPMLTC